MKKEKKIETKEEKLKTLKRLIYVMLVFDVFALIYLGVQIYFKDITYSSYVVLLFSNFVVFLMYKLEKSK